MNDRHDNQQNPESPEGRIERRPPMPLVVETK